MRVVHILKALLMTVEVFFLHELGDVIVQSHNSPLLCGLSVKDRPA
jgi:hypothetical protein